jgi:hypothetical protein
MIAADLSLHLEGGLLFKAWDPSQSPKPPMSIWLWRGRQLIRYDQPPSDSDFYPDSWVVWQDELHIYDMISSSLYPFSVADGIGDQLPMRGNLSIVLPIPGNRYVTGGRNGLGWEDDHYFTIRDSELNPLREFCPLQPPEDPAEVMWNDWVAVELSSSNHLWVVKATSPTVHIYDLEGTEIGRLEPEMTGFVPHPEEQVGGPGSHHRAGWTPLTHFSLQEEDGFFVLQWEADLTATTKTTSVYDLEGNVLWREDLRGLVWHVEDGKLYVKVKQTDESGRSKSGLRVVTVPLEAIR